MDIFKIFEDNARSDLAPAMKAYLRGQFEFLGLKAPVRRELARDFLKEKQGESAIDWALVEKLWARPEREFQYLACDYLIKMKSHLTLSNLTEIRALALRKSWWDTVDNLDELVGFLLKSDPQAKSIVLSWSQAENFWLRRLAIDCQLGFKTATDTALLATVIGNNFGSNEFFINKAIGWALRDYSKTNPTWVAQFILSNLTEMDKLSVREASKYLDKESKSDV